MTKPYVNFRELKAAVPISRVLERYGVLETLESRGKGLSGPCPFCEGETSFRVDPEKSCFHCFSCRAGGNMLDLVAAREECSVRDAALRVAEWFGLETSKPVRGRPPARKDARQAAPPKAEAPPAPEKEVSREELSPEPPAGEEVRPRPAPNRPLTFELKLDPGHPWFAGAGLLPETVREFGLGFCPRGMMAGRIAFPLRNAAGELVGYAGLRPGDEPPEGEPLWKYPRGLDLAQVVYPAERLGEVPPGEALFASDPLRVVLCWQLGVKGVFFVPGEPGIAECTAALDRARGP